MLNRNEFRSQNILPFVFTAFLLVCLYSTVKSSDLNSKKKYPVSATGNYNDSELITSKKNHFSVAKKQKFLLDSVPSAGNNLIDSVPSKITDSTDSILEKKTWIH
jgi:hypothetical protein